MATSKQMVKNRIKALRTANGLSLAKLGEQVGLRDNTISQYETGRTKYGRDYTWQKLADFFGVSVEYLKGENAIMAENKTEIKQIEATEISTLNGTKIITPYSLDFVIDTTRHIDRDTTFIQIKGITDWLPFRSYKRSEFKDVVIYINSIDHMQSFKVKIEG